MLRSFTLTPVSMIARRSVITMISMITMIAMFAATLALTDSATAQLDEAAASSARNAAIESPPERPDLDAALTRAAFKGRVISVTVIGRIGNDIAASGFELLARHHEDLLGATALVIELDSEDGSEAAALRITRALLEIGESVPVFIVVRRALGPAALLLLAADRVFIAEPALPGTVIAIQPEAGPLFEMPAEASVTQLRESLSELLSVAPRREVIDALLSEPRKWQMSSGEAFATGLAEPLEGGLPALGRTTRLEPWVHSGRAVEEILRRSTAYAQQLQLYRLRVATRAFAALGFANESLGQLAMSEYAALRADPRQPGVAPAIRVEFHAGAWVVTPSSVSAWERSCDVGAAAWLRVAGLHESAAQHLRAAGADIGALLSSATIEPIDPLLPLTLDRLEIERSELERRVSHLLARAVVARAEAAAVQAMRSRIGG